MLVMQMNVAAYCPLLQPDRSQVVLSQLLQGGGCCQGMCCRAALNYYALAGTLAVPPCLPMCLNLQLSSMKRLCSSRSLLNLLSR